MTTKHDEINLTIANNLHSVMLATCTSSQTRNHFASPFNGSNEHKHIKLSGPTIPSPVVAI